MRKYALMVLLLILTAFGPTAQSMAGQATRAAKAKNTVAQAWTTQFESAFSRTWQGRSFAFSYPKEFTVEETPDGVLLEASKAGLEGRISYGVLPWTSRADVTVFLEKQGVYKVTASNLKGSTLLTGDWVEDDALCRVYVWAPQNAQSGTVYAQFYWNAADPDYAPLLDRIIATLKR